MLEKIQTISTNLDKKRVYTGVGALIIALATGHVMQRTINAPDAPAAPAQVAAVAVAPGPVDPVAAPAAETQAVIAEAPEELTRSDESPATEDLMAPAPMVAAQTPSDDQTPMQDTVDADVLAGIPGAQEQDESIAAEVEDDLGAELIAMTTEDPELYVTDVTRASSDATSPLTLDAPGFDVAPAAVDTQIDTCAQSLDLSVEPGAMIGISYSAPCDAGGSVEFDHLGLMFTERLGPDGTLTMAIPAMSDTAVIVARSLGDDGVISQSVTVPNIAEFVRVALVWKGGTGLQLHALENGAYYGDPGHIWAEEPGLPSRADNNEGGFLTVLGSVADGYAADVYTYPASLAIAPDISIEAQVLETTCQTAIMGSYLTSVIGDAPTVVNVGMAVPGCDAVGEYLVLKNLAQNLTIAEN